MNKRLLLNKKKIEQNLNCLKNLIEQMNKLQSNFIIKLNKMSAALNA